MSGRAKCKKCGIWKDINRIAWVGLCADCAGAIIERNANGEALIERCGACNQLVEPSRYNYLSETCDTCREPRDTEPTPVAETVCGMGPPGWACRRRRAHDGPCAAYPSEQETAKGAPAPTDMINAPPHYARLKPEPIDVIEAWRLCFHLGQVLKYIARAGFKGSMLEDLKKARFFLDRKIAKLESGE